MDEYLKYNLEYAPPQNNNTDNNTDMDMDMNDDIRCIKLIDFTTNGIIKSNIDGVETNVFSVGVEWWPKNAQDVGLTGAKYLQSLTPLLISDEQIQINWRKYINHRIKCKENDDFVMNIEYECAPDKCIEDGTRATKRGVTFENLMIYYHQIYTNVAGLDRPDTTAAIQNKEKVYLYHDYKIYKIKKWYIDNIPVYTDKPGVLATQIKCKEVLLNESLAIFVNKPGSKYVKVYVDSNSIINNAVRMVITYYEKRKDIYKYNICRKINDSLKLKNIGRFKSFTIDVAFGYYIDIGLEEYNMNYERFLNKLDLTQFAEVDLTKILNPNNHGRRLTIADVHVRCTARQLTGKLFIKYQIVDIPTIVNMHDQ